MMYPYIEARFFMPSKNAELALECKRQSESCLYTSTSLFIWLRVCRYTRTTFIVLGVVFGSLSTWSILTAAQFHGAKTLTAALSLLAGLLPAMYAAVKLDDH